MIAVLAVAVGGAAGAALRYVVAHLLTHGVRPSPWLPVGTLVANTLGCFVVGWASRELTGTALLLVATGFCGGLTTWSTLAAETDRLAADAHRVRAVGYLALTLVLGGAALVAGILLAGEPSYAQPL